jgi:hypothetical protein
MAQNEGAGHKEVIAAFHAGKEVRIGNTAVRHLNGDKVSVAHYLGLIRTEEQIVDVGGIMAMAAGTDTPETHIYHELAQLLRAAAGRPSD